VENELLENINQNIEVIIGLLIRSLPGTDTADLRGRILVLSGMGMRPKDIARILSKSTSHVSKELSLARTQEEPRRKRRASHRSETANARD
jgi:hypothetical protein